MSKDYSLTEALGVFFIFASIVPSLWFFSAISLSSPLHILLAVSPMLMVIAGWGLIKKKSWARGSSILLMLFVLIYAFYQYWFLGTNLLGVPAIIFILGILIFDKNQSQSIIESEEMTPLTSKMDTI